MLSYHAPISNLPVSMTPELEYLGELVLSCQVQGLNARHEKANAK
jgi:hypothetical protein